MLTIKTDDCRIDSFSAGTWVRVTHLPSGLIAESSDRKTKQQNIAAALSEIEMKLSSK